MADGYKVGNLEIAFKAVDETSASFKELVKNLRAINSLVTKLGNADLSPFIANIKKVSNVLTPMLKNISGASEGIIAFNQSIQKIGVNKLSKVSQEFANINQATDEATNSAKQLTASISSGATQLTASTTKGKQSIEELVIAEYNAQKAATKKRIEYLKAAIALDKAGKNTKAYRKELEKLERQQNKGAKSANKFLRSIGRIAFYRTIRRGLQLITQSVTESINEFAKLDDNINDTMSRITSSLTVLKLSTGTIVLPFLQAIHPILSQIAVTVANFANTMSQAMATGDTYWAINANAIKDYREQLNGATTSFDKFNVLQGGNDKSIFFEEKEVDKENKSVSNLATTIKSITNLISSLFSLVSLGWNSIIKPILSFVLPIINILISGITKIVYWISTAFTYLNEVGLLKPILIGISGALALIYAQKVISGIQKLVSAFKTWQFVLLAVSLAVGIISNWDSFSSSAKTAITVIASLTAAFTAAAVAVMAYKGALTLGAGVALITTAVAAGAIALKGIISSAKGYENGGLPDKGTMFYAGEAGAEIVYNMPSGQSGVANINQLKSAFYQALVEWGNTRDDKSEIIINLDGEQIYKSVTSHAKRRGEFWS